MIQREGGLHPDILAYNAQQSAEHRQVCDRLAEIIAGSLPDAESKVWHRHPVWFLDGNPTVGYSGQKRASSNEECRP